MTASRDIAVVMLGPFFGVHPLQTSLIRTLTDADYRVTLFYLDYSGAEENLRFDGDVDLRPLALYHGKDPVRLARSLTSAGRQIDRVLRRLGGRQVIAIEPAALFVMTPLARLRRKELIYLSQELIFLDELRKPSWRAYKRLERFTSRRAQLTLTQDPWRADALAKENRIPRERVDWLPNSDIGGSCPATSHYLHDRLGLDHDRRIILHPGSPGMVKRMLPELKRVVADWPEEWALVLHLGRDMGFQVAEADGPPGLIFSERPVPTEELPELYASADVGVALYFHHDAPVGGKNLVYMGWSSGKFNLFLRYGKPVVTTDQFTFGEIYAEARCGEAIVDLDGLTGAVERILADQEAYSQAAVDYYDAHLRFEREAWRLLDRLD